MSLLSSINIAQQALSVNQAAITTVSNNIANVDTEGYSKLRVNQAQVVNYTPAAGNALSVAESCSGVKIASVSRYSDWFLQNYYWQENTTNSYLTQSSSVASNVEGLVNELKTTGLSSALENFYTAASVLSNSPSDITARQNYVDSAQNVCTVFNDMSNNLTDIKTSLAGSGSADGSLGTSEISNQINKVNTLLDQLANVNYGIVKTSNGDMASNSLLDQRDSLLGQLAELTPISIIQTEKGTVKVSLGDTVLVSGLEVKGHLKATETGSADSPVRISVVDPEDSSVTLATDVTSDVNDGSMGAILDICGTDASKLTIYSVLNNLNTMASEFANVLNKIQVGDPQGDGSVAMAMNKNTKLLIPATNLMFVSSASPNVISSSTTAATVPGDLDGTVLTTVGNTTTIVTTRVNGDGTTTVTTKTQAALTAANISVNSNITGDPYLVAAARVTDPSAIGVANQTGNNSNVALVLDARTDSSYYSNLGGTTIEKFLSNAVSSVGSGTEDINTRLKNQTLVLNEIQNNLQAKTGVNMDEELTDLIKYQRAYQASARIYSVCSSLMEELVHLGQ